MYKITNLTSGEIVCNLVTKGKTLRVGAKSTQTIEDTEITPYLFNIENKGLIMCTHIKDTTKVSRRVSKDTNKIKEE